MSQCKKQITDVVVFHAPRDMEIVELLTQELIKAGLAVSCISTLKPDEDFLDQLRVSLVECHAVVILLTRSQMESPNLAVEVGAAMAWNKPIYVLHDGLSVSEIPDYLQRFHIRPLNRISEVVAEIAASRKPLSD